MQTESKVTEYKDYCVFCGKIVFGQQHHLLFGQGIRPLAEADGIKVPICNDCHTSGRVAERIHDNPMAEKLSKMFGQSIWERNYIAENGGSIENARAKFIRRYGKSYY